MRIYLLPENATYLKANLHNHTVLSDGHKTPEEIKRDYMAHGYSVVAFTDHDKYFQHNDLTDDKFVALNGFELEYYLVPWKQQTCHLCFIAKRPDIKAFGYSSPDTPVFVRTLPEGGLDPDEGGMLYQVTCPGRKYNPAYINADIEAGKKLGFFVTYNHPTWSLERYPQYSEYRGMDAMEISNYSCITAGFDDDNGRVYEDMLQQGNRIACIAADDNHNRVPDESVYCDSYGGYIMLAADKIDYASVIEAMEQHRFYACSKVNPGVGECPVIKNLWLEDGIVHVEAEGASHIMLYKDIRNFKHVIREPGQTLQTADFELGECTWFRLVLTGENGCKAYTKAYFMDQLK